MDNIIYAIKDFGILKTAASVLVLGLFVLAFVNGGKGKGGSGNSNNSTTNTTNTPSKP